MIDITLPANCFKVQRVIGLLQSLGLEGVRKKLQSSHPDMRATAYPEPTILRTWGVIEVGHLCSRKTIEHAAARLDQNVVSLRLASLSFQVLVSLCMYYNMIYDK